jgi:hypothetical protein
LSLQSSLSQCGHHGLGHLTAAPALSRAGFFINKGMIEKDEDEPLATPARPRRVRGEAKLGASASARRPPKPRTPLPPSGVREAKPGAKRRADAEPGQALRAKKARDVGHPTRAPFLK